MLSKLVFHIVYEANTKIIIILSILSIFMFIEKHHEIRQVKRGHISIFIFIFFIFRLL